MEGDSVERQRISNRLANGLLSLKMGILDACKQRTLRKCHLSLARDLRTQLFTSTPANVMILRLSLLLVIASTLTSCSLYPLGHSKYGHYYGGQGDADAARVFVPRDIQRQEPLF